jgi:hypothetical protein
MIHHPYISRLNSTEFYKALQQHIHIYSERSEADQSDESLNGTVCSEAYELKGTNAILMTNDYEAEVAIPNTKQRKRIEVDPYDITYSRLVRP